MEEAKWWRVWLVGVQGMRVSGRGVGFGGGGREGGGGLGFVGYSGYFSSFLNSEMNSVCKHSKVNGGNT